jgi:small subunit ribosomal protein S18
VAAGSKRRSGRDPARPAARERSGLAAFKRRSCGLCKQHVRDVDYKDIALLQRFLTERGKIRARQRSGACRRHQRLLAVAIKRAREMALLAYVDSNNTPPERRRSSGNR